VILTSDTRLYVHQEHPEYSIPEVINPRDAAIIMAKASRRGAEISGIAPINLYKEQRRQQSTTRRSAGQS